MNKLNLPKLLINADDFGLSGGINKGIIEAHKNGVLTSTSICANGDYFDEAVELAKKNPSLDLGLHFILVGEKPLSSPNRIPSLTDGNGNFHKNIAVFTKKYFQNKINLEEVKYELNLQIDKVKSTGLNITHVDSHQHVHALPKIYKIIEDITKVNNINIIRVTREKISLDMLLNLKTYPRVMQLFVLNFLMKMSIRNSKCAKVRNFRGFYRGGNVNKENLMNIISKINKDDYYEIMCHPAYYKNNEKYEFWNYNHEDELNALLDDNVKKEIENKNIELIKFSDI
ncbi:MAG: hypothetical protein CR986_06995 [Ignavibacteriae bacterium]|nr:MAG: hypothetical protein CR986_06995 [Ignavibacteriota bacterium]